MKEGFKMDIKSIIYHHKYYAKYDARELLLSVQGKIDKDISVLNEEFALIFDMLLNSEPSIYWNKAAYNQTTSNLEGTYKTNSNLLIDDACFEYFLMGYSSYIQLSKIISDLQNFNIAPEIKIRLYHLPTYTSIMESCIANFSRFICNLTGQAIGKDYSNQNTLGSLLQIMKSNGYSEIETKLNINLRNAINHGKVKLLKENGFDSLRFHYSENNTYKQTDLKLFEFERIIDDTFDMASAMLLAIVTFLNNHISLLNPFGKQYLNFELFAMKLSLPGIVCQSISDTGDSKQLNIDIEIKNTNKDHINEVAFLLSFLVYEKYNNYEQYMFFFSNPRMQAGWVRYKNKDIVDLISSPKNVAEVYKRIIARSDYILFPPSQDVVDLNEVKYFCFPNISTDTYKINRIQDASQTDRKRLRANLFLGETESKEKILEIILDGIEKLKNVKNPPSPKIPHKYGSMEADALYINVYRFDTRKDKQLYPSNDNFVCMVDYNLSGETTLEHGGIFESIWSKLYHEKIGNVQISWRESKFAPKRTVEKIGRNDPCPCGSGKKYKKCCLK